MRINGVYLSYDLSNKKQMEAADRCGEAVSKACMVMNGNDEIPEKDKENIIAQIYTFFGEVFGDEKAFEVLGESANLTECLCACADYMEQVNEIAKKAMNAKSMTMTGNRQARRAIVHKKK